MEILTRGGGVWVSNQSDGLNEQTVRFCSISGQAANPFRETGGLGGRPERSKNVKVFRHLFRVAPGITAGGIDMLPAKR